MIIRLRWSIATLLETPSLLEKNSLHLASIIIIIISIIIIVFILIGLFGGVWSGSDVVLWWFLVDLHCFNHHKLRSTNRNLVQILWLEFSFVNAHHCSPPSSSSSTSWSGCGTCWCCQPLPGSGIQQSPAIQSPPDCSAKLLDCKSQLLQSQASRPNCSACFSNADEVQGEQKKGKFSLPC